MEPIWEGKRKYEAFVEGEFGIGCEEDFYGTSSCVNKNGYGSGGNVSVPIEIVDVLMKEVGICKFTPRKFRIVILEIEDS